jgi:hypothetical protein
MANKKTDNRFEVGAVVRISARNRATVQLHPGRLTITVPTGGRPYYLPVERKYLAGFIDALKQCQTDIHDDA